MKAELLGQGWARYRRYWRGLLGLSLVPLAVACGVDERPLNPPVGRAVSPLLVAPVTWVQRAELVASDGMGLDRFGQAVAASGNTIIVGAPRGDGPNINQGSAYVFVRTADAFDEQQELLAVGGSGSDEFGLSVAIAGDTALVGAPWSLVSGHAQAGAAYVFVRSGVTWSLQQKLVADDPTDSDRLGYSVALSGDTALLGAPTSTPASNVGHAYVFVRSGSLWSQQQKLAASATYLARGMGVSATLDGDTAILGAPHVWHSNAAADVEKGAAYVFTRSGTVWAEQAILTAGDPQTLDNFGEAVALSGNTLLASAPRANGAGAAYVLVGGGASWAQQQKLIPAVMNVAFAGSSVALAGDLALAGSESGSNGHSFLRGGSTWTEQSNLVSTAPQGRFSSVAVMGESAVAGSALNLAEQGAVNVFDANVACATDTDCPDAGYCANNGYCMTRKPLAAACDATAGADCEQDGCRVCAAELGGCFDGFCCDLACGGECQACSVAAGSSSNGKCSSFLPDAGALVCSNGLTCTGTSADCANCTDDDQCPTSTYCATDGTCKPQRLQGDACGDCYELGCRICTTVHCVDGFCCDQSRGACSGCNGCAAALTGLADGTCGAVVAGTDPRNICTAGVANACDADGSCDGAGACRAVTPLGVPCGATTCASGMVSGLICNGDGACTNDSTSCAPFTCGGTACTTTCEDDSGCANTAYCSTAGVCQSVKRDGLSCTRAPECESGLCVDGVCCKTPCEGQCEACGESGKEGTCSAVMGEPRGERLACSGEGTCAGTCNTSSRTACAYPGPAVLCGSECSDGNETLSHCDGLGACVTESATSCGDYACGGDACLTECADDSECATGYRCESTRCIPQTARCSDDRSQSTAASGLVVDCKPYLCASSSGECPQSCASTADCATGNICEPSTRLCSAAAQASSGDDGGCGCRTTSANSAAERALLALLALIALRRRRRS